MLARSAFLQSTIHPFFFFLYICTVFAPVDWLVYVVVSSTTKAFRNRDISTCFCSPAICSMRTGPLSIDLPSVIGFFCRV